MRKDRFINSGVEGLDIVKSKASQINKGKQEMKKALEALGLGSEYNKSLVTLGIE